MATVIDTLQVKFEAVGKDFERGIKRIFGKSGTLARVAGIGAGAAAAAVAGFAAKSIAEVNTLDEGVRKVLTLWPDATSSTFDEIANMAQQGAREFGIPVTDMLNGIYDALGSGVPPENLFSFVSTAAESAIGGASNLNATVDALTTAINSYGTANLDAKTASDILFTAVDKGKISWDEFGTRLSTVLPLASSAGVPLDQVAAGMAAMTAQGRSAAEASTALRSMIQELRDPTSDAAELFEHISGQTFPDFIAGGGTIEGALQLMATNAEETNTTIDASFSNIRAQSAALALGVGNGAVIFSDALAAMDDSSGATQDAYEVMAGSMQNQAKRIQQQFDTLAGEVGQRLLPAINAALAFTANTAMPALGTAVNATFDGIATAIDWIKGVWHAYQTDTDGVLADIRGILESYSAYVKGVFEFLATLYETVIKPLWLAIAPSMKILWDGIAATIGNAWDAIKLIITTALDLLTATLQLFTDLLRGDWGAVWQDLHDITQIFSDAINGLVKIALDQLLVIVTTAWDLIKVGILSAWSSIGQAAGTVWNGIADAIKGAFSGLAAFFQGLWDSLIGTILGVVNEGIDAANRLIEAWNGLKLTIPEVHIPGFNVSVPDWVPGIGGKGFGAGPWTLGGQSVGVPQMPTIPHLAAGGIVDSATLALIGESGPEAVVPLDKMGGDITIVLELDGRVLTRAVAPRLVDEARLRLGFTG